MNVLPSVRSVHHCYLNIPHSIVWDGNAMPQSFTTTYDDGRNWWQFYFLFWWEGSVSRKLWVARTMSVEIEYLLCTRHIYSTWNGIRDSWTPRCNFVTTQRVTTPAGPTVDTLYLNRDNGLETLSIEIWLRFYRWIIGSWLFVWIFTRCEKVPVIRSRRQKQQVNENYFDGICLQLQTKLLQVSSSLRFPMSHLDIFCRPRSYGGLCLLTTL